MLVIVYKKRNKKQFSVFCYIGHTIVGDRGLVGGPRGGEDEAVGCKHEPGFNQGPKTLSGKAIGA